jgi:hypothetical protein
MAENPHVDPSGNTEQFRAFAASPQPPAAKRPPVALIVGIAIVALIVIVLVVLAVN